MEFFSRVRFLPVTIFAAVLMLTVKLGNIWEGVDGLRGGGISVSDALAQAENPPAPGSPAAGPGGNMPSIEPMEQQGGGIAPPEEPYQEQASRVLTDDPTLLTQAEIDLLQQLAERREALEARDRELEQRAGLLRAAEERIDIKISDLKQLQKTIEGLIQTYDDQQDKKLLSLVKIYENMKPKDAAKIFETLEMETLLMVAERMKERKLAPIMAKMNPDRAKEVTVELVKLRNMPDPGTIPPVTTGG